MKKIIKSTLVVAVLAVSAAIGYVSYNQYQNQQLAFANPLMEENIEALADDGNVPNGYILKEDPLFKKECYHKVLKRAKVDEEAVVNGMRIGYKTYDVSYEKYVLYDCKSYRVSDHQYFEWWKDCTKERKAICNHGDIDFRPNPMNDVLVDYEDSYIIGPVNKS